MASPDDGVVLGARRENRGRELCTGMKNVSEETMMDELAQPLSVEHEHECAMGKLQVRFCDCRSTLFSVVGSSFLGRVQCGCTTHT